jgi:hypothetical protein
MKAPKPLSLRTQAEQAAGRGMIDHAVKLEVLMKGDTELKRRFPSYLGNPHLERQTDVEWTVEVRIQCANGSFMNFKTPFLGWPSDLLITEMMLVAP